MATLTHHREQVRFASGLDVLAAIWLFISAFVVPMYYGLAWSNAIVAVIVFILAGIRASNPTTSSGLSWVNFILGIWVLISPWAMHTTQTHAAITNNVIMGIIMILLPLWSALATGSETTTVRTTDTTDFTNRGL
jgi:hypothetical protein